MSQVSEVSKSKKRLQTAAWVIGVVALTAGLVYFMWFLEAYFRLPLGRFAPLAYLVVFGVTLLSSSTIIFPAPGVAVIMAAASKWNPAIVAVVASVGSTLGELTGYYAGYWGRKIIVTEHREGYNRAVAWMNRYGLWAIFVFALIPVLIFDLMGLVAGALRLPVWKFLLACWGGRIVRSFIEAYFGAGAIPFFFPSWFL
ncbi:MAG TPA: VTT domain-containing protein [Dehalococcoidia bacterium]|nr:VTT domain-containing protein [Dehalococcoidia bacterium]